MLGAALACNRAAPPDESQAGNTRPDTASRQTGSADLELKVNERSYAAADTVRLQLVNRSTGEVGYNLCTTRLEHRRGGAWTVMPDDRVCTMELRLLAPADSAASERPLDRSLAAGEYRLVAVVDAGGQMREVASAPFTVSARVAP